MESLFSPPLVFERNFVRLLFLHCWRRDLSPAALAEKIIETAQTAWSLTGQTILNWESNIEVPDSTGIYAAAVAILIDENDQIPHLNKTKARRQLARRCNAIKACLDRGLTPTPTQFFGPNVRAYRIQQGLTPDDLAKKILERILAWPREKMDYVDFGFIAKILTTQIPPSRGFFNCTIQVLDQEKTTQHVEELRDGHLPKYLHHHFPDICQQEFSTAYLAHVTCLRKAKERTRQNQHFRLHKKKRPVSLPTEEVMEARRKLLRLFSYTTGKPVTRADMKYMSRGANQLGPYVQREDYSNFCCGERPNPLHLVGSEKLESAKQALSQVVIAVGKEDQMDEFNRLFNIIADEINAAQKERPPYNRHLARDPLFGRFAPRSSAAREI